MARPKKSTKHPGGRPTVMTEDAIAKLEQAFAIDATVEEACSYADISRDAFYDFIKKNPKFSDRIADLRNRPILKARQTVVNKLSESYANAVDYLKRKRRQEFGDSVDMTSAGEKLNTFNDDQLSKIAARILNGDSKGKAKSH